MRIFYLSTVGTVIFDVFAWIIIHYSIGLWSSRIPVDRFDPQRHWYLTQKWEKGGEIYQKWFRVKEWKKYIPSGASLYANTFKLKTLPSYKFEDLNLWLKESCRAEFCHLVMILPGFLFFLWNSVEVGWGMVAYAVINNLVPIIMQRYNRPRVRKLLARLGREARATVDAVVNEPQQRPLVF